MVKDLLQGQDEWARLEAYFKLTMPQASIQSIQRIQNKKLWRHYQNEVEDVATKHSWNRDDPIAIQAEAEMYHGTSGTPPIAIYKSEEGFDMTYSKAGLWGHANYFAKDASYSDQYAFTATGNGTK